MTSLARRLAGLAAASLAVAALAVAAPPPAAAGQRYPALFVFGDSLSDTGNVWLSTNFAEPKMPPYSFGRFTNGRVWAQDFAIWLGLPHLTPSLLGGRDYAFGGAESGTTAVHTANATDLPAQIAAYTQNVKFPRKGALYALWIGANDISDILANSATLGPAGIGAAIQQVVTNEVAAIDALHATGAENFLVLTVTDIGKVPEVTANGPAVAAAASAITAALDTALAAAMTAEGARLKVKMTVVDTFAPLDAIVADPAAYGFTDATTPCWTGTYFGTGGTLCSVGWYRQNQHLFWDKLHPTAAGHRQVAAVVEQAMK